LEEICSAPVLLVEDNDINQMIAKEMLQQAGLIVDVARNGEEAVTMVKAKSYALVFMDIQMPVMDGLTAAEKIRGFFSYQQLPIIAMTANSSGEDIERSLAAGMQDHISKPIDEETLLDALEKWCVRGHYMDNEPASEKHNSPIDTSEQISYPNHNGIDFNGALERLGHNLSLYQTLVERLYKDYHQAPQQVVKFLSKGQHDQAKRFFHSLKGASANLGLTKLSTVAATLEQSMSSGAVNEVADNITRLDPLLEQAREAVADLVLWQQRQQNSGKQS
ncbi:MAG: hybrid sensor histidine kinase/response regulator, partial [Idiomarina sp. 34-48-12]